MLSQYHHPTSVTSADELSCSMIYASSAIAAQSFARNMMASSFPLFMAQFYRGLSSNRRTSIMWAAFVMAMISALLAIIPFVLFIKGESIRKRSKVVRQLLEMQEAKESKTCSLESQDPPDEQRDGDDVEKRLAERGAS